MKIAVISDTHNMLRKEVIIKLKECDMILHAGDICSASVYDELTAVGKPMYIVRGNNDGKWAVEKGIPFSEDIYLPEAMGLHVFMIHDFGNLPSCIYEESEKYDLVVTGHSHRYSMSKGKHAIFLNPGSCGPTRFFLPVTMAIAEVSDEKEITVQKIQFDTGKKKTQPREISPGEMKTLVTKVVKDIKSNKSAEQIAKKHKISLELSEQICRLYLTHPGVTVDGILGKMGL